MNVLMFYSVKVISSMLYLIKMISLQMHLGTCQSDYNEESANANEESANTNWSAHGDNNGVVFAKKMPTVEQ